MSVPALFNSLQKNPARFVLFAFWLVVVIALSTTHVFWRDEVRAFSIALQGDTVFSMLAQLHGEGHPALWYIILRAFHAVIGAPWALPAAAITIAAAAFFLLTAFSPFKPWMIALVLASPFALNEASVSARNYGLSALCLFAFASLYPRFRNKTLILGLVLACLANSNAHSVFLALTLALYWLADLRTFPSRLAFTNFLKNMGILALGILACFAEIYPTYNDTAASTSPATLSTFATALFLPGTYFDQTLTLLPFGARLLGLPAFFPALIASLLLFGASLATLRQRAAPILALLALWSFSFFFSTIYAGGARHQYLLIIFLLTLFWLSQTSGLPVLPRFAKLHRIGILCLTLLFALDVPAGVMTAMYGLDPATPPQSRSRDFATWLKNHPELAQSTIVAEPDFLLEALPYYLPNTTYLMREDRAGPVVHFTYNAKLDLSLGAFLSKAQDLRAQTGHPVVILMRPRPLSLEAPQRIHENDHWLFTTTPDAARAFLKETLFAARFPPALGDESFDVFVLP